MGSVVLDFKNGFYSIAGVPKAVHEVIVPGGTVPGVYEPMTYSDIIPGTGLRVISRNGNGGSTVVDGLAGRLTPAARAEVLDNGVVAGFTGVMTFITYVAANNQAYANCILGDGEPITQGWGFQPNWAFVESNLSVLYDFNTAEQPVIMGFPGRHKSAFTLGSVQLAASIDGAAASTVTPSQGTSGEAVEIRVTATTDDDGDFAICVIEKIEFMDAVSSDDLPDLSEPDSDGLLDYSVRIRSWGYQLDGHKKVIWRLGPTETLEYDLTTRTWAVLESPGRPNLRAHCGQNWLGMSADTLANGFGSDVVCGDDVSGVLFVLDPTTGQDDRSTTGADPFRRVVTGGLSLSGREVVACGALQLDYSAGNPSQDGAAFTLDTSDDFGNSFDSHGTVEVEADDFTGVVEWRALGTARAPGRVFRITDNGAAVRISGATLR